MVHIFIKKLIVRCSALKSSSLRQKGIEVGLGGISLLKALSQIPMKEGGRVTKPKGVGKATCGYGKAMRNKRK